MIDTKKYDSSFVPTWCPGCGGFGAYAALKNAFAKLNFDLNDVCLTYDIGCSSNMANFNKFYGISGLHGRCLPLAAGVSMAHHKIPVVAIAGDGGAFAEGLNHLIASCRANYNLTYIVLNNQLYSLTTGQTSPTTFKGELTKSTPFGAIEEPFNPLNAAISNHASFVARGFAGNINSLTDIIVKGIRHQGFSYIDVLMPCITWHNKTQPYSWYQERVYQLEKEGYPKQEALRLTLEDPEKLPLGIFYQDNRPPYQASLPQLKNEPLIKRRIDKVNIGKSLKEFI